jgi:hypothetical protein
MRHLPNKNEASKSSVFAFVCLIAGPVNRYYGRKGSVTQTTWHPLSSKIGTNFADKRLSPGWYCSLADTGHGICIYSLSITFTKMCWLLGRSSRLSLPNKLLLYKSILKPIWTYGIQLWGTASTSNIEILERFQWKALRIIVDALWYVPNNHIRRDLQMTSVKKELCRSSNQCYTRLTTHSNDQILTLMEVPDNRRLRRHVPNDLPSRFLL